MTENPQATRALQRKKRAAAALKANIKRRKASNDVDEALLAPEAPDLVANKDE